jgi:hypothetical protein
MTYDGHGGVYAGWANACLVSGFLASKLQLGARANHVLSCCLRARRAKTLANNARARQTAWLVRSCYLTTYINDLDYLLRYR